MSDVILDGAQVTILCNNLNVQGHDLLLSSPARRRPGGPPVPAGIRACREQRLTMNFAGDYPGGITCKTG